MSGPDPECEIDPVWSEYRRNLFAHFAETHNLMLLSSEMDDVEQIMLRNPDWVKARERIATLNSESSTLLARVKELEQWKADADAYRKQFNVAQMKVSELTAQLHQRDTALVSAREALEKVECYEGTLVIDGGYIPWNKLRDHALSQIQAVKL